MGYDLALLDEAVQELTESIYLTERYKTVNKGEGSGRRGRPVSAPGGAVRQATGYKAVRALVSRLQGVVHQNYRRLANFVNRARYDKLGVPIPGAGSNLRIVTLFGIPVMPRYMKTPRGRKLVKELDNAWRRKGNSGPYVPLQSGVLDMGSEIDAIRKALPAVVLKRRTGEGDRAYHARLSLEVSKIGLREQALNWVITAVLVLAGTGAAAAAGHPISWDSVVASLKTASSSWLGKIFGPAKGYDTSGGGPPWAV